MPLLLKSVCNTFIGIFTHDSCRLPIKLVEVVIVKAAHGLGLLGLSRHLLLSLVTLDDLNLLAHFATHANLGKGI